MTKKLLICFTFLFSLGCVQRVVHEQRVTEVPTKPYKAAAEASDCITDRAVYVDAQRLKPSFVEATAIEMAQKFNQSTYEIGISDCVTTDGTGRQVVVFMCPSGAEIKDHFCYPDGAVVPD